MSRGPASRPHFFEVMPASSASTITTRKNKKTALISKGSLLLYEGPGLHQQEPERRLSKFIPQFISIHTPKVVETEGGGRTGDAGLVVAGGWREEHLDRFALRAICATPRLPSPRSPGNIPRSSHPKSHNTCYNCDPLALESVDAGV